MVRIVVALSLLILVSPALAAPVSTSTTLGYSCTKPVFGSGTPTCTCVGYFDCQDMVDAGVCKGKISSCDRPLAGGKQTCKCEWKTNVAPTPSSRKAPVLKMQTK
jgi:hypothetical protein